MSARTEPRICELFRTPSRFLRSTNLERDFDDPRALDSYIITPFLLRAFHRVVDGAASKSGRRAWRITGDYGVGKSSFALFLAQYFADQKSGAVTRALRAADAKASSKSPRLLPVLVTGERERLHRAIARGMRRSFELNRKGRTSSTLQTLLSKAEKVERSSSPEGLQALLDLAQGQADREGRGILLVLDEMGKFLEYAGSRPESEDIFVLQDLSERAVRSGNRPFIFIGMLHQGFQAYSERLPFAERHEWDKVAGRFEEIVFDQPLVHSAMLVSRALAVDESRLPKALVAESKRALLECSKCGWFGRSKLDIGNSYPLHPTLLPVLVRFFARFGQHERSLFGFLLSNEPFGLQEFAQTPVSAHRWYRLAHFFDYVRANYGHRLSGESYRNSWLRIIEIVDRAHDTSELELDLIKTIAILNLIDAEDLAATDQALTTALGHETGATRKTLESLLSRGLLFRRGQSGVYRLWGASSVDLQSALRDAFAAVGETKDFATELAVHLDRRPMAARRHYLTKGTLRYFDVRFVAAASLNKEAEKEPNGDGSIVVALPQTEAERTFARMAASKVSRRDMILLVPEVLSGLNPDLRDVRAWQFVIANTPELSGDPFALAEAERQVRACTAKLVSSLEDMIGLRTTLAPGVAVYQAGSELSNSDERRLSQIVSEICDRIYKRSPKISNELLNRNTLSSAAAAARMRLIEGIFAMPDRPLLGIDEVRAPPEKSMYLSVLEAGNVHRTSRGRHFVEEPPEDQDPLNLRPALSEIMVMLEEAKGARVSAEHVNARLRREPFGVRDGVIPLLLAIVTGTRAHEIAVYESGTFLHNFGPAEFLRLTKQPSSFELQLCRVVGIRAEVFRKLLDCFATDRPSGRQSELLDVVTPLCRFAAQLPEFTRRTSRIDDVAVRVRDVLLTSTDPSAMLFVQLPEACGIAAFDAGGRRDTKRTVAFVTALHDATNRLRDAYPTLLTDIVGDAARALDAGASTLDRAKLASRGARVALVAKEARLKAFAQRLRDPGLSEDAWIEALASFVASKPPSRWLSADFDKWKADIATLGHTFLGVEATAFSAGPEPLPSAVRLGLTRADGAERARVIDVAAAESPAAAQAIARIEEILAGSHETRVPILYKLLWEALGGTLDNEVDGPNDTRKGSGDR